MVISTESAEMLRDMDYEAVWMEDVIEGDDLAIPGLLSSSNIILVTVKNLRQSSPQYERDNESFMGGKVLNPDNPHYIYSFVGAEEGGIEKHYSYGKGYGVYRKKS